MHDSLFQISYLLYGIRAYLTLKRVFRSKTWQLTQTQPSPHPSPTQTPLLFLQPTPATLFNSTQLHSYQSSYLAATISQPRRPNSKCFCMAMICMATLMDPNLHHQSPSLKTTEKPQILNIDSGSAKIS